MFLRKPVTKEKIENMNKNKLFKVFVLCNKKNIGYLIGFDADDFHDATDLVSCHL